MNALAPESSASVMAIEMFGPAVGPYAAIACVISFLMTGHRSVYPSEVLSLAKSSSLTVDKGSETRAAGRVGFQPRPKTIFNALLNIVDKVKAKKKT